MAKWAIQKWFFNDKDQTASLIDECVYGETSHTKREAEEYLDEMQDSMNEGAEILGLSNPGDADEYVDSDWDDDNIQLTDLLIWSYRMKPLFCQL